MAASISRFEYFLSRSHAMSERNAAALTYVAALAVSLANLIRLLLLVRGRNDRRR
ncbi:MAG: zinc metallopeptidase [Clostridia bacterium]|nr:zinc metallopeptidase [Clostridia bacterium]